MSSATRVRWNAIGEWCLEQWWCNHRDCAGQSHGSSKAHVGISGSVRADRIAALANSDLGKEGPNTSKDSAS